MKPWQKAVSAAALVVVLLIAAGTVLYDRYSIVSSSMAPTLTVGDRVFMRSGATPSVNDIIVFEAPASVGPANGLIVSRLVAVGGQEVAFIDGEIRIDDAVIGEPFLSESASTEALLEIPGCAQDEPSAQRCLVPEGHVFVMGDNRRLSSDSRVFGPVDLALVRGAQADPPWWLFAGLLP